MEFQAELSSPGSPATERIALRSGRRDLTQRMYCAANALSLEIVLGVVAGAAFAAWAAGASMPASWWFALPATTWVVYSVDHLLDARRSAGLSVNSRHRFHRRHTRSITTATSAVALAILVVALRLPAPLRIPSALLAAATLIYLVQAQGAGRRWLPKELVVASLYTAGIWFGPLLVGSTPDRGIGLLVLLHFIAALLNLMTFSVFERRTDAGDLHPSIVGFWGPRTVRRLTRMLTLAGLLLLVLAILDRAIVDLLTATVLTLLLLLPTALQARADYFRHGLRYRLAGDGAFALLALPALFHGLFG